MQHFVPGIQNTGRASLQEMRKELLKQLNPMKMMMMTSKKTFSLKTFLFTFFLLALTHTSHATDTDCEKAKTFMSDMGTKVIALLTNSSISDKERADEF